MREGARRGKSRRTSAFWWRHSQPNERDHVARFAGHSWRAEPLAVFGAVCAAQNQRPPGNALFLPSALAL